MKNYINKHDIINYYDQCQIDYELAWHLKTKMYMHYGYWDNTTKNLRQALTNMDKRVADYAQIKKGDYILDAGCGVGGSSIFLAKTFDCTTKGINLCERQINICRLNAAKHNVTNQCTFETQNYLATNFNDNTFDVVWAIESVCHAFDKSDFLRESFRILKPGGRVIVTDYFSIGITDGSSEAALINKWANAWAIKISDKDEFWNKMENAGFINRKMQDETANIEKTIKRMYHVFFLGLPITYTLQAIGIRNKTQTKNVWSAYYQYNSYKKGLWKYMFFSAQKPAN